MTPVHHSPRQLTVDRPPGAGSLVRDDPGDCRCGENPLAGDVELVAGCLRGEAWSWEALVRRYQRLVYAIVRRMDLDEHTVADAFQTVFVRLRTELPRIAESARLQAWIVTTARREALLQRRRGRRTVSLSSAAETQDQAWDEAGEWDVPDGAPLAPDALGLDHPSDAQLTKLAAAAIRLPDAPPHWVDAALAVCLAEPGIGSGAPMPTVLNRIAAALTFDSWGSAPATLSVRTLPSDVRHLLYSAEGRDIDVRITSTADRFCLAGQILGPDEIGDVELTVIGAAARRVTQFDPLGEFRLEGLHAGIYQITLRIGADEILLPPVVIRQRAG